MDINSFGLFVPDGSNLNRSGGTQCYFTRSRLLEAYPDCLPQHLFELWKRVGMPGEPYVLVEVNDQGGWATLANGFVIVYTQQIAQAVNQRTHLIAGRTTRSNPGIAVRPQPLSEHIEQALTSVEGLGLMMRGAKAEAQALKEYVLQADVRSAQP